ncbi:MAG: hypothetical protein JWM11_4867, partial [Planctomycetaceae bacterium]|nr:hypothetical protein [Planctomycetaceae bacterium]
WADILATSDLRLGYFARVADYERDEMQRLNYFLPSLEPLKSFDHFEAVKEFAQTKMDDLVRFAPQLPRMKLRQWIRDPKTDVSDVSEFGWLLGLCGTDVDAKFLDEMIFHHPRAIAAAAVLKQKESADADELTPVEVLETPEDEPFDETLLMYEGLVKGYFYLRGVRGLDHLEERILNNSQESRGRKYVVIDAAESMSEIAKDRIPATRLKLQMLRLLDRPDFARLAILTFLQKQDWTLQDKIAAIYSKEEFNTPRIHSAIVEYLLGSAGQNKDVKSPSPSSVEDAQKATRHLERIRRLDPEVFTEFE